MQYVRKSFDDGLIKEVETTLLESLVTHKNTPIKSLLIPRHAMLGINLKQVSDNLLKTIRLFKYNTIPIYDGLTDNIVGVVSKKMIARRKDKDFFSVECLKKAMVKPKLIPESRSLMEVFYDMSENDSELAIITDEHGGIEGIVSYGDVVNRLIGKTKSSTEEISIRKFGRNNYAVHPYVSIESLNRYFSSNIICDKIETVGGYVLEIAGEIPQAGRVFKDDFFEFTVREASKTKIENLSVRKLK